MVKLETTKKLRRDFALGKRLHRGERPKRVDQVFASDPGDFGRGLYYTTSQARARQYGPVLTKIIKLQNPLILSDAEAYQLSEEYETVKLNERTIIEIFDRVDRELMQRAVTAKLLENAQKMTDALKSQGFDGLVSIRSMGHGELEVVKFDCTI